MVTEDKAIDEAEALSMEELRDKLWVGSNYGTVEIHEADRSELEGMYVNMRLGRDPFR